MTKPETPLKTKDSIRVHLARLIIEGTLEPNDTLPNEATLANDYGVSRTSIRDVLQSLEEKGLVERKTNIGTRVRSIHSWNLLDEDVLNWSCGVMTQRRFFTSLMELRLIIEPQAACLAAIRANDAELQDIQKSFARMNLGDQSIDPEGDVAFHQAIINATGNMFISQFGSTIRAALYHTIYQSGKDAIDQVESLENHRQLMNSIENRDPQNAHALMGQILCRTVSEMGLPVPQVVLGVIDPDKSPSGSSG